MRLGLELWSGLSFAALAWACTSESAPAAPRVESGTGVDAAAQGAGDAGPGAPATADGYCETIADSFCAFYMRCGRMVAGNEDECRTVFLETCNARFEPRYVDLERAGLLALSRDGVMACKKHLADVACEDQMLDLAGPCGSMWSGTSGAGAPCGIDVESFVCAPGNTCVLGLDLCGSCQPAAKRGEGCGSEHGGLKCASDDTCENGTCVQRSSSAAAIVGEGASCDATHRCAYRSFCSSGKCVRASLLGEPCTGDRSCASGRCQAGTCVALRPVGDACASSGECSSGLCQGGECRALPSACFAR